MPKRLYQKPVAFINHHAAAIYLALVIFAAVAIGIMAMVLLNEVHKTNKLARDSKALATQNQQLIKAQQASRIESCKLTYGSYVKVFDPFFPPRKQQTPEQRRDWNKLLNIVQDLQRGCATQTMPEKKGGGTN